MTDFGLDNYLKLEAKQQPTWADAALLEHVLDRDGVHKIDYLIGDDEYKQGWMNRRQERGGLLAGRLTHPMGLSLIALEFLKRRIKALARRLELPRLKPPPQKPDTRYGT